MRLPRLVFLMLAIPGLSGCYLSHVVGGQLELLSRRQPIADLVTAPTADPALQRRLQLVQQARAFSIQTLRLPDNGSYTQYADLERPYAVWNVFAAPEFSLEPKTWCYLFLGCLAYRGYFDEQLAQHQSREIAAEGFEVYVGGVSAYSTLGWFDDPVLNAMLRWDDDRLVETVFHELAHQQEFVAGDTEFNESFATFVGEEGLRRFRATRREPQPDRLTARREDQFLALLAGTRERLTLLYEKPLEDEDKRAAKQAEFTRLRAEYRRLRASWGGYAGYDGWFEGELNNARLVPVGLYRRWLPAFAALFRESAGDWSRFYEAVRALAETDPDERIRKLERLAASS